MVYFAPTVIYLHYLILFIVLYAMLMNDVLHCAPEETMSLSSVLELHEECNKMT